MRRLVEFRSYTLKAGAGPEFLRLVREESAPLHAQWGIDIVAFGQSVHDVDAFYLIRAYENLAHLKASQDALYGSAAWRDGAEGGDRVADRLCWRRSHVARRGRDRAVAERARAWRVIAKGGQ